MEDNRDKSELITILTRIEKQLAKTNRREFFNMIYKFIFLIFIIASAYKSYLLVNNMITKFNPSSSLTPSIIKNFTNSKNVDLKKILQQLQNNK